MDRAARRRLLRVVSAISGIGGLAYVVISLVTSADDLDRDLLPSPEVAVLAFGLHGLSLLAGASGFAEIAGRRWERRMFRAYATSQLAKYLPGGVWQPASQITTVARGGTTVLRSASEYFSGLAVFLVAGATVASATAFVMEPPLPTNWRVIASLGLVSPLLLVTPVLRRLIGLVPRIRGREITSDDLPPGRRIAWCFVAFLVTVVADAAAFALLLVDLEPGTAAVGAGAAFAAAWLIGVIAVPVPSGIGIREAVLLGAITDARTTTTILAASLSMRLLSMLAEVVFAGATWFRAPHEASTQEAATPGAPSGTNRRG